MTGIVIREYDFCYYYRAPEYVEKKNLSKSRQFMTGNHNSLKSCDSRVENNY